METRVLNPKVCPFCKKENGCMAHTQEACWCNEIEVPLELRAHIPEHLKMKACICKECILLFKNDPKAFESLYLPLK